MSDNKIVCTKPYFTINTSCECAGKTSFNLNNANKRNKIKLYKFKRAPDRDYVGKYCLVDWVDDTAIIDCSLIHEWD
ncbi:MAG: hypothetical protein R8G33_03020 [Gammaproteobacteria bacterium]|nr:hypothetical protein [Gammaproteobacteria bacterium]